MILKAFKEKSNQKYVEALLSARTNNVGTNKVVSIGVLLNAEEFDNQEAFQKYFKALELHSPKHKILTYSQDDSVVHSQWDTFYGPKDFGWKGKIKSLDLETFIDTDFDVLICYYKANTIELNQVAVMSKAELKVGLSNKDERLYDLIIDVKPSQFEVFKTEFKKYLTILNKL
ncbi:hypothetical protein Q2T40_08900 [Winogradskyella maritima]|uniref:DUF6913 domain-containing protein n=1 Tax=Winogradskyella maritima TaxID=1517766 RepID=A0ABV8AD11_9FLAO|nr:hypothetical protein [Winogradskyella maritima]